MPNFIKYFQYQYLKKQLKKKEVQVGILVGVGIFCFSVIVIIVIKIINPDILKPHQTVDQCIKQGLNQGKLYFQDKNNCRGKDCKYLRLNETEAEGFLEFANQLKIDCQKKYGQNLK